MTADLGGLGLDPRIVEILRGDGITSLYPPQEASLPAALAGENLVLAVPTASGKSLVAYLALLQAALRGEKGLYIVPLRALAAEKYDDLSKFASLGIRVVQSVGDFDTPDPRLEQFDIIIATSEKADALLRHQSRWLQRISVVIADEIHLIHDPERGPTLEVILARFRQLNPSLQIIALSATIQNSQDLAEWLGAQHFSSTWRPVPLREGVYLEGTVQFTDNTKLRLPGDDDPVPTLVKDAIRGGGQCLVFVNTRRASESLATSLGPIVGPLLLDEAAELKRCAEDARAIEEEPTSIGAKLARCLRQGTAFHNAGLTNAQRRLVETQFRAGKIKCIVATPTLASGMNLPARRVVVRDARRFDSEFGHQTIPVLEIKQMCGRAGRPRYDTYGEAILLAKTEEERAFLLDTYLLGPPEEIRSKLGAEPALRNHVLAAIATGLTASREGLMAFFHQTFLAHQTDIEYLETILDRIIEYLQVQEMVRDESGHLSATFFGRRTSDLYIDPLSAVFLRDALRRWKEPCEFGVLQAICATPNMLQLFLRQRDYETVEREVLARQSELLRPIPTDLNDYEFFLAEAKTALLLSHWMDERSEDEISESFNVGPGDIRNRVELADWLLYAMRELAGIFQPVARGPLLNLVPRLRYGVRPELCELVKLRGIGRVRARLLHNRGYESLEILRSADIHALSKIRGIGDSLARSIKEQLGQRTEAAQVPQEGQRRLGEFGP